MQKEIVDRVNCFSFGNSFETINQNRNSIQPDYKPRYHTQLKHLFDTPKFPPSKQKFRSTKKQKQKVHTNRSSEQSLFANKRKKSKSQTGFLFSLTTHKSQIGKIEINCNNCQLKPTQNNSYQQKSLTPRVFSRHYIRIAQQSPLKIPKVLLFKSSDKANKQMQKIYNQPSKLNSRKTFNRKLYIDKRLPNTKTKSYSSFFNTNVRLESSSRNKNDSKSKGLSALYKQMRFDKK